MVYKKTDREVIIFDPHYDPTDVKFSLTILQEKFVNQAAKRDDLRLKIVVPDENSIHQHLYYHSVKETGKRIWGVDTDFIGVSHDKYSETSCDKVNLSWKKIAKEKDYYVYFTPRIRGAFDLVNLVQKGYVFKPTLVLWLIYDHQSQPWFSLNYKLKEMVSFAMVNFRTIFTNQMIFSQWHNYIKKLYSPALIKKFEDNSLVINLGIDCDLIDKVRSKKKNDIFTFVYGGRLTKIKGIDVMIEIVEKLNAIGKRCNLDLFLTLDDDADKDLLKMIEGKSYINVYKNPKEQAIFLNGATRAHAYLCPCQIESYGMSWLEMMYAGCVGIYLRKDWQKNVLPANYPFLANNKTELLTIASYVYDNYNKIDTKRFVDYVFNEHNTRVNMNKIADYLRDLSYKIKTKEVKSDL